MKKKGSIGLSRAMLILFAIVLLIYIALVGISVQISLINTNLTETSRENDIYSEASLTFTRGADILSDECRLFVSTGDCQYMYAYMKELNENKLIEQAIDLSRTVDDEEDNEAYFQELLEKEKSLSNREMYAMKLAAKAYGINESVLSSAVNAIELTEEDMNLTKDRMHEKSRLMVLGADYQDSKDSVANLMSEFINEKQTAMNSEYNDLSTALLDFMSVQEVAVCVLLGALVLEGVVIFLGVVKPLTEGRKQIKRGKHLSEDVHFKEIKHLAKAYNTLIDNREKLEEDLRNLAETDTLTLMGNRYAMNVFLKDKVIVSPEKSLAVIGLDLNGLKKINDTKGHDKGDELLRNCADCILECLGDATRKNCFRVGGDEFIALVTEKTEAEVDKLIKNFEVVQKERGISIAYGCVYEATTEHKNIDEIIKKADELMYDKKMKMKAAR